MILIPISPSPDYPHAQHQAKWVLEMVLSYQALQSWSPLSLPYPELLVIYLYLLQFTF